LPVRNALLELLNGGDERVRRLSALEINTVHLTAIDTAALNFDFIESKEGWEKRTRIFIQKKLKRSRLVCQRL
jgi:hypothetical protein